MFSFFLFILLRVFGTYCKKSRKCPPKTWTSSNPIPSLIMCMCSLVFMSLSQSQFYVSSISSSEPNTRLDLSSPAHDHRQEHALVISHQAFQLLWHFVSAVRPARFTVEWIWAPSGQSCPIFPGLTALTSYDECALRGKEEQSSPLLMLSINNLRPAAGFTRRVSTTAPTCSVI